MSIAEKLTMIAENQQRVYDAGMQAEYDALWDSLQQNGTRSDYRYAFGVVWNDETFKPKYDLQMKYVERMFAYSKITDLKGVLEKLGISLVWRLGEGGAAANVTQMFQQSSITRLPAMDVSNSSTIDYMFYNAKSLVYIEKLILPSGGNMTINSNVFQNCEALQEIRFAGVIGRSLDMHWSARLSHESLMSIIGALKDYAESGTTYTLTLGEANLAKLTDAEKLMATQKGWTLA